MKQKIWTLTAVCLFILLAALLRAYHLDHFSFWIDEALTPLRASQNVGDIVAGRTFIQEAVSQDTHPPFYYLIVYITRQLWGDSDYAYRYVSLLMGVLLVPVMFQLGRSLLGRWGGLTAALLVAINPLYVWYSQEARMYTLLVLLGALSTYILVRALTSYELTTESAENAEEKRATSLAPLLRWFGLYVLVAGLTLYTHYTAVFLIAIHALFWAWILWQLGYKKLILAGIGLAILAALPLIPLTVPRLFTGAESGYTYRSPLVLLNDVIGGFSMGVTAPSPTWLRDLLWWGYLLLLGWGAWATTRYKHGRVKLLLLLGYLLATVIGLALGSLLKPMYQGVRHIMLGSPAFLLLLTAGIASSPQLYSHKRRLKPLLRAVQIAGWTIILLGSLGAVWNLYTNPAVAKDDLRAVVAYLEREAAPGDLILYNDAILMLAHWHYATRDDVAVTAVPIYPHAIRPETPQILADLAAQHERIWFLPPVPNDGRDPNHFVRAWVAENLHQFDTYSFTARSTNLKVDGYRTGNTAVVEQSVDITFDNLPSLVGYSPTAQTDTRLWFDLFWQGTEPTPEQRLIFTLVGPDGWAWTGASQQIWLGTEMWPGGDELVRTTHRLRLPEGLPAGTYDLRVQGWDDGRDVALGEVQTIAQVDISGTTWTEAPREGLIFGDGLHLVRVTPYDTAVKPGNNVPINLLWAGDENRTDWLPTAVRYDVQLVAPDGTVIDEFRSQPGANWLDVWPSHALVGEFLALQLPSEAAPGTYTLRWRVVLTNGEYVVYGREWWQPSLWEQEWLELGQLEVEPWPFVGEAEATAVETPVNAQFDQFATLLGYDLSQTDEQLDITLQWRADETTPTNYFVFVHLIDPATGQPIRQRDWTPVEGLRPTAGWRTGEILFDPHTLDLTNLPPGTYQLNVGLYVPGTFERPLVTQNGQELPNRQVTLRELVVSNE